MIICEYEFLIKDKKESFHSFVEIDFYSWIPPKFHKTEENHRLTLWKNLKTGEYELIKVFQRQKIIVSNFGLLITNESLNEYEVVFKNKDLRAVIEEANGLWNHYHGYLDDDYIHEDQVCSHEGTKENEWNRYCWKKRMEKVIVEKIFNAIKKINGCE